MKDIFAAIDSYQPIRHKDPEHFKSVVTGLIPVDENDEGFSSIRLNVKMDVIYTHFKKLVNDYEVMVVQELRAGGTQSHASAFMAPCSDMTSMPSPKG